MKTVFLFGVVGDNASLYKHTLNSNIGISE